MVGAAALLATLALCAEIIAGVFGKPPPVGPGAARGEESIPHGLLNQR